MAKPCTRFGTKKQNEIRAITLTDKFKDSPQSLSPGYNERSHSAVQKF